MSGKQRRTGTVGGIIDVELLVQIAHLYYDEGMTQQKIAKKLNMSRSLVSKLLAKAKEKGIVKVTISDEVSRPHQPLEARLKKLFGLSEVIITPADSGANNQKLAQEAGRYLTMRLSEVTKAAVSAGRTTREIAEYLSVPKSYFHVVFVPMSGGLSDEYSEIEANSVSELFAMKCGAKSMRLHAPILVDSAQAKDILKKQYFIKNTLDAARAADIAVVGIGNTFRYAEVKEAYLHGYNAGELPDSKHIKGDLSYNYFDKNGNAVDNTWNSLLIGLSLEEIKRIPEVICVADEVVKAESIYIAAKSGLINTLITNEMVAQKVLWYHAKSYGLNTK